MYRFSTPASLTPAVNCVKAWDDRESSLQGYGSNASLAAFEIFAYYVMARYLHLLLLDSSSSDYVYFEFQFQLRPTVWTIVLYINGRTSSMKAPHTAVLCVVFASDITVQSGFIFLKLLWSFFTLLICIDPCKSQGYEKYGGGQGGGFSLCNSVQNTYRIGFTGRKAYKVTGLKEQQNNGMSVLWLSLCFQSFLLSNRSHRKAVSEAERGTIR